MECRWLTTERLSLVPEQAMNGDYTSVPKITNKQYDSSQKCVAIRTRALGFTNEEIKDVLLALGLVNQ